jgi:ABC-type lipoprotein release transport system permease subunit
MNATIRDLDAVPTVPPVPVSWLLKLPYPVRTVIRRWRGLTGMVIGVGIALGIGMLFLGVSKSKVDLYSANFVRVAADLYVVQRGGTLVPILPSDTTGSIAKASGVIAQVRAIKEVRTVVGIALAGLEQERESARNADEPAALVTVMGVDGDPSQIDGLLVPKQGRWLRRPDEVMVGTTLAREKHLAVGDPLRLSGRTFTIVGIGRLRGSSFGTEGYAYLDYQALRERSGAPDSMSMMIVDVDAPGTRALAPSAGPASPSGSQGVPNPVAEVRGKIVALASVAAFEPAQLVELAETAMKASYVFSWLMIALTLAIAALFVSNMLGRSVAERRIEFATLRAIGLPARTVLATVAGEAAVIICLAWLFGLAMAWGLGAWTNVIIEQAYGLENMYVADPPLFIALFVVSALVGLAAGLVPARQATAVDPVEVLRDA